MPNLGSLKVTIEQWGPTAEQLRRAAEALPGQPTLAKLLAGTRSRLLFIRPLYVHGKSARLEPPTRFQATLFDYTNNQAVLVLGEINDPRGDLQIAVTQQQPMPTFEEFHDALNILLQENGPIGSAIRDGRYKAYRPLPALFKAAGSDKRSDRIVAVGLLSVDRELPHLRVGVNLIHQRVEMSKKTGEAGAAWCGLPDAEQHTERGAAGAAWITITQSGEEVWKFLALRPAATGSDGGVFLPAGLTGACTNGGGIELWNVDYRGQRVLGRAHVPIVTVKYFSCRSAIRDWQHEEGKFDAVGVPRGDGFLQCASPPATIIDSGNDFGTFNGVAVYVQGDETVLVSEMQAGEYRYVCEWRLNIDGRIRPRFGFSVTASHEVCPRHVHHAYWRFDFDIQTASNNIVREFNPSWFPIPDFLRVLPFFAWLIDWLEWTTFTVEQKRFQKNHRRWQVLNADSRKGYDLIPGDHDTPARDCPDWKDKEYPEFPVGDVWILRNNPAEIDDGISRTVGPDDAMPQLDPFVSNSEPIEKQDVVIWYGGHVVHDFASEPPGTYGHVVGPTLQPVSE